MKISINSAKMHKLFPNDTIYGIIIGMEEKKLFDTLRKENVNLVDNINNLDFKYVSEIINIVKKIEKNINLDDVSMQINVNDYSNHEVLNQQKVFSQDDLSSKSIYSYPEEKMIFLGTKYMDYFTNIGIEINESIPKQVEYHLTHEISHVLEHNNRKKYRLFKKGNILDFFMELIDKEKNTKQNLKTTVIEDKLKYILKTQASEMYADIMAILLIENNQLELCQMIYSYRKKESIVGLNDFGRISGIMSDHLTLSALDYLKENLENKNFPNISLEDKDYFVQKAVRFGLMKNILFMLEVQKLKEPLLSLFNEILPKPISMDELKEELKKEIGEINYQQMKKQLSDENIHNKYALNRNQFMAVFHNEEWEKEKQPILMPNKEELKSLLLNLREQREKKYDKTVSKKS